MEYTLVLGLILCISISWSQAGIVENARACPNFGTGTFIQMRLVNHDPSETDCVWAPCNIRTDATSASYEVTIRFVAGEQASKLLYEIWFLRPNGGVTPLVSKDLDTVLAEGTTYDAFDNFTIPARFNNNPGDLSVFIKNLETESRIICGEFPIFVNDDAITEPR